MMSHKNGNPSTYLHWLSFIIDQLTDRMRGLWMVLHIHDVLLQKKNYNPFAIGWVINYVLGNWREEVHDELWQQQFMLAT